MSGQTRSLVCNIPLKSTDSLSVCLLRDIYIPLEQSASRTPERNQLYINVHISVSHEMDHKATSQTSKCLNESILKDIQPCREM